MRQIPFSRFLFSRQFLFKNNLNTSVNIDINRYLSERVINRCYSVNSEKQNVVKNISETEKNFSEKIITNINNQIINNTHGRLFAVVSINGQQYKVTNEDILVIRYPWGPTAGDKIRLEKVLLVGSSDFTLIGRPLLPMDQVCVLATIIENTFTHAYPLFLFRKRKNRMKLNFKKDQLTYLRITDIILTQKVNENTDTDGFKNRIF